MVVREVGWSAPTPTPGVYTPEVWWHNSQWFVQESCTTVGKFMSEGAISTSLYYYIIYLNHTV